MAKRRARSTEMEQAAAKGREDNKFIPVDSPGCHLLPFEGIRFHIRDHTWGPRNGSRGILLVEIIIKMRGVELFAASNYGMKCPATAVNGPYTPYLKDPGFETTHTATERAYATFLTHLEAAAHQFTQAAIKRGEIRGGGAARRIDANALGIQF